MKRKRWIFLILHYKEIDVTDNCIKSILKQQNKENVQIVVVDNGSRNTAGEQLKQRWGTYEEIDIIILDKNEGFSHGNNIGYSYIRKKYDCDYIIVMNSDVEINDNNFCSKLEQIYNNNKFAVLGPDILQVNTGMHQNPEEMLITNKNSVSKELEKEKKHRRYYIYYSLKFEIRRIFYTICYKNKVLKSNNINYLLEGDNFRNHIKLHGACIIFRKEFIEKCENLFEPETFLYCEEDILALRCQKKHLKMLYSPEIQVLHFGSASSNLFSIQGRKKFFERRIEALQIVDKYIQENFNG